LTQASSIDLDVYLAAIAAGDSEAFARWLAGAEATIRSSLRSFAVFVDTEAILQESLLRVWQVTPRFQPDGNPNSLVRLAVRIARNLAVSERRRRRAEPWDDTTIERRGLEARVDLRPPPDPMLRRVIEECRALLPEKPAQALAARLAAGGLEPDEVLAERLGMRPNTFLQNFGRARKLMAQCLAGRGVDLEVELP
jgi:RNA polymerase sigma-70 factor (ECF subfamily)